MTDRGQVNAGPADPWRPDWRNEKEYPSERLPEQWAWELVRRNPDYQSEYAKAVEDWERRQDPESQESARRGFATLLGIEFSAGEEDEASPEQTAARRAFQFQMEHLETARKWGLAELLDPATRPLPDEARGMFASLSSQRHSLHVPGTLVPLALFHDEQPLTDEQIAASDLTAAAILDLGQPLNWQLKKIGAEAKRWQTVLATRDVVVKPAPTTKFLELREALRLLDAWAEERERWGRSDKLYRREVASVLFPGYCPARAMQDARGAWTAAGTRVSDALGTAKELLQPEKYLSILKSQRRR